MFKKFLACLLTLALVLSFAACGAPSDVRGELSGGNDQPTEKTEEEFSVGSSTGNTYSNKFIGIQCTLGNDWVFKTDAEMREVNQATADMLGDQYKDMMSNAALVYDMMATNVNQTDTVSVILEKLSGVNLLISEQQYLDLSKDSAVEGLKTIGLNITSAEVTTIQFAGEEHKALVIEGDVNGAKMYETMVIVKCNGYIACITVATWLENTCMDILNQFKAY